MAIKSRTESILLNGMTRYKLTIEYMGTNLSGWQRQTNGPSIQEAIEKAIYKFCGENVTLFCAGRTDAGVHALGQVAHFDLSQEQNIYQVRNGINFHLKPQRIAIINAEIVNEDFHARFAAKERTYIYKIVNRSAALTLDLQRAWHVAVPLNAEAMHEAGQVLVGQHDFTSFRATQCQSSSPNKTIDQLSVVANEAVIEITTRARSFLHHQVRNMVGTLKLVGEGKWTNEDVRKALEARDRSAAGPTAPPDGLYLLKVNY